MKFTHQSITSLSSIAMALFLLLFVSVVYSQPNSKAEQTIQHLLNRVSNSSLIFVRNNQQHSARDAAEHINSKYQHFKDDIKTPEDFIDKCASKSLLSGRYYQVIDKLGNTIRTRDWLMAELVAYRGSQP